MAKRDEVAFVLWAKSICRIVAVFLLATFAAENTIAANFDDEAPSNFVKCKVKKVVNGDDMYVVVDGKEEQVHLLNVDCPERDQEGEADATAFVKDLVEGKTVALTFNDEGTVSRDKYGRLLAYVRLGAKNINVEIVRAGWSSYYTRFGKSKNYDGEFEAAEKEAKANNRGMWKN